MPSILTTHDMAVCPVIAGAPPSIADAESSPTAATFLPQVQLLTPRGAAWGTDEAAISGPTVMKGVWTAIAGTFATLWSAAFDAASQAFPSAITWSLAEWEAELALPEPDEAVQFAAMTIADRVAAVQAKDRDRGGASPGYFICIAAQLGYTVNVLEPGWFEFGLSCFDGDDQLMGIDPGQYWIVQILNVTPEYFSFGASAFGDALTDFPIATALEARIRRRMNIDTAVYFDYSGVA